MSVSRKWFNLHKSARKKGRFDFLHQHISVLIIVLGVGFMVFGCIEEFNPGIKEYDNILVIDGSIVREDSIQTIRISRSTRVYEPEYKPLSGCQVRVVDNNGKEFLFKETLDKVYESIIPQSDLGYGKVFQLFVRTPEGNEYKSDFEEIQESSPIDSVYYIVEEYQSSSEFYAEGLQFYADLKAPNEATKNYRWTVEETWEIQAIYDIDGQWKTYYVRVPWYKPIHDFRQCWKTQKQKDHYTASTENLIVNEKKKIPLHYIPGTSPKLNYQYSVLIRQYTLSNDAYRYHEQNNFATGGDEGLYQHQPAQSRCNIKNVNDPDEVVLGYFWASSYTEKRLFFSGPLTDYHYDCEEVVPVIAGNRSLLDAFRAIGRDVYLIGLEFSPTDPTMVTLWGYPPDQECIDCTANGGTMERPDFW